MKIFRTLSTLFVLWLLLPIGSAMGAGVIPPYVDPDHVHSTLENAGTVRVTAAGDGVSVNGNTVATIASNIENTLLTGNTTGQAEFVTLVGGNAAIRQRSTGFVVEDTWAAFARNAGVTLYYNNAPVLTTESTSARLTSTTDDRPFLSFYEDDNTSRAGFIQFHETDGLRIESEHHGVPLVLAAEDAGGTVRELVNIDPDGGTTGLLEQTILKTADQSFSSTTAQQNDTHLVGNLLAGYTYELHIWIIATAANGTPDLDFDFAASTVSIADTRCKGHVNTAAGTAGTYGLAGSIGTIGTDQFVPVDNTRAMIDYRCIFTTSGSDGTITFRWAQNVSNATATTVEAGSFMRIKALGAAF